MFRNILSSRLIQVGLVFFVVVVGGSLLYNWHVHRTTDAEVARTDGVRQDVNRDELRTAADTTDTSTVDFQQTETPLETDGSQMLDDTNVSPIDETSKVLNLSDAFLPDDLVSEEAPTEDVPVSPFGFGNFPEIPSDFPRQDVWDYFWKLYDKDEQAAENYELINRVVIQLWKEGGSAPGGVLKRGKVYPLDNNTAYITWKTAHGPNGETKRYISNLTTTPDIARRYAESHFRKGLIPSGVNVIEHSEGGYNPYDFVNP